MPPKKKIVHKGPPKGCELAEPAALGECDRVITIPQMTGICWFTAIMMSIFFSENSRRLLLNKMDQSKSTEMSVELKAILWDIMQRRYKSAYEMKDYAYMFFKAITPENILKKLHEENPKEFEFDPEKKEGYFNYMYLPRLYKYMGAKEALLLDYSKKTKNLYHSVVGAGVDLVPSGTKKKSKYRRIAHPDQVKPDTRKEFDIVIIYDTDLSKSTKNVYRKNHVMEETFEHMGKTYILDSMMLTNFNTTECKKGHDICGITCEGKRFMYNGWVRHTVDSSMIGKSSVRTLPCEIMEYDWLKNDEDFCINPSMCKLDAITDDKTKILKKDLCFNVQKGERVYVYVSKELCTRAPTPKSPKTPDDVDFDKILKNVEKKKPTQKSTECPPGKIRNPKTGRCVKEKQVKECPPGKVLNTKTGRCVKAKEPKECPPGKVRNPKTGRCVKEKK